MKKTFFSIAILVIIITIIGCRGSQQNRLVGYWEQIPFTDPEDEEKTTSKIYWQFYAGDEVLREIYSMDTLTDTVLFRYNIDGSVLNIFASSEDQEESYTAGSGLPMGEYWVDVLTNDNLKATRRKHPDGSEGAAFIRLELVKRN